MTTDAEWMARAVALARSRVGRTGASPAVGCVIVRDGRLLAEAATGEGGRPHAEEQALDRAVARGATAYVTLEPCGERSSGALACSSLLMAAGIARVVVACADPSPMASGRGLARLRLTGVVVDTGIGAAEAAPLYADYLAGLASPGPTR